MFGVASTWIQNSEQTVSLEILSRRLWSGTNGYRQPIRTKYSPRPIFLNIWDQALVICVSPDQCAYCVFNVYLQYVQNFINQTWRERYQTNISADALTLLWSTAVSIFTVGGLVGVTVGGTLSMKLGRYGQENMMAYFGKTILFSILYFSYKSIK